MARSKRCVGAILNGTVRCNSYAQGKTEWCYPHNPKRTIEAGKPVRGAGVRFEGRSHRRVHVRREPVPERPDPFTDSLVQQLRRQQDPLLFNKGR